MSGRKAAPPPSQQEMEALAEALMHAGDVARVVYLALDSPDPATADRAVADHKSCDFWPCSA